MSGILQNYLIIGSLSFFVSVIATFIVRLLAARFGFVAKPTSDRWHKKPTAMMGGVAIFVATMLLSLTFVEQTKEFLVISTAGAFLFLVGLIDDVLHIKPYQKLVGQLIGVAIVVGNGLTLHWTDLEVLNICITAFWLIGITNAINLLDNMDGLATGISVIAACAMALVFHANGETSELLFTSIFIGGLLGFLVFNFNPASIFMGDSGSMFIGFLLSSLALLNQTGGRSRNIFSVLAVPVLILFVPIFDTTFVTLIRKLSGRRASDGGKDHTSHRLVALGLSERRAVLMLYGFAVLGGGLSLMVRELHPTQSFAFIALFTIVLVIMGVYLAKVKVYAENEKDAALENRAMFGFLLNLSYKRRIFEVVLDVFLISLAYYSAYIALFGPIERGDNWRLFIRTLPILIVLKLFAFLIAGIYRGIWRYTSVGDLITFAKGVALGSTFSILALLLLYRFENLSRRVFLLDALLLFLAIAGSRMAFRLFRQLIPAPISSDGRRVLIYGAGDGGELVLRELHNNPEWNYNPVGFVDDDPHKTGRIIHGLRVFEGNGALPGICSEYKIDEVLISSKKISTKRIREMRDDFKDSDVSLKRVSLVIEPIDFE